MAAMIQRGPSPDNIVPVVMMTHETEKPRWSAPQIGP
jgi:hypothetical protein